MSAKLVNRCLSVLFLFFLNTTFANEKAILPIKQWQTKSGTPVLYVHEGELPIVDIQMVFDAGSSRDGAKLGISKITIESISSGTNRRTANDIAALFDNVGARFSAAVNRDMALVAMRSLSDPKFFQPAFNAFADVLAHASFPDKEFLRIQKQTLNSLAEQEEQPSSIATKAFYRAVYDATPYGHPISGTQATVAKLTANDLRQFYKSFFTAQNGLIAIVGDISEDKARQLAETLSSQLNQGPKQSPLPVNKQTAHPLQQYIAFPSSQTHVLIGQVGINRNSPDYFPAMVGNYILGGGLLTSRLFNEVREKRGLVYSVYSQFNALKDKGPFVIELQTRNSEVDTAIRVVNDTLNSFVETGPTQLELESAKKNLTQGFILRLTSNSAIIGQLINIGYYKLPLSYLDTYQSNIAQVTDKQVREVFKNIIHPKDLVTIKVGDQVISENVKKAVH